MRGRETGRGIMLRALVVSSVLAALPAVPAAALQAPDRPGAGLTNAELVAMLDTYALVQAQETLQLDDGQYGQFVVRLRKLQETRRRHQQARNRILQDLRRLSDPKAAAPPGEDTIRERLKALREVDERAALDMRSAYDAVDELLNVRQQARFRLFEENVERRKLDLLMRARERAARLGRGAGGS